jgi:CBS domain containing-hemolysin-like protein
MNDSVFSSSLSQTETQVEEPPSWWRYLWHRLRLVFHPRPDADILREVVEEIIDEPLSQSGISQAERMLLGNIMALRERTVSHSMVQRADIIAADIGGNLNELLDLMAAHGHSRIPIYRDTLDDVIGMVHMKDIVPCLAYQQVRAIADLLRPVMFVAPSMPASKLLLQMRQNRQHMALVVDEFGGIDGLVTIEDLVEEIVGEIEDEHDAPQGPPIIARADGTLMVDAKLSIEEFTTQTGVILPPLEGDEVDTLGGYVGHIVGRVPHIGEKVKSDNLTFEVLEIDQNRIKRLRIRAQPRVDEAATGKAQETV